VPNVDTITVKTGYLSRPPMLIDQDGIWCVGGSSKFTVFSRPYLVRSRYWYAVASVVCRRL